MKLKNFLLGSLCMIATTASAQLNGNGYYVVKSNSGKYLSVEGNSAQRVDGYFKDLKLNDAINNKCIMYITVNGSAVKDIKVGNISALEVIAEATDLGTNAKFDIQNVSGSTYKARGYNDEAEVYLKENNGQVGTKGGANSDLWEIIPYSEAANALPGDANGDGYVTASDMTLFRKYLADPESVSINPANADITGDGNIRISDLNAIKDIILNQ